MLLFVFMKNRDSKERLSYKQKNSHNKKWYKDKTDLLDNRHTESMYNENRTDGVSEHKRMKVNYDLFNNILNLADFEYVCKPYGAEVGELPAKMTNRDITSGKIKAVLGMEMKKGFSYKVLATNPEATTRKEQAEFNDIKQYVINEIMKPIRQETELKYQEQLQNKELTEQEKQEILKQLEQEISSKTPDEVKKYHQRDHQDPVEIMSHQLLEYLFQKCEAQRKFNKAFLHGLLTSRLLYYVGNFNGKPDFWNVNPMSLNFSKSDDEDFIQNSEWATCEYFMTPSTIIKYFGKELKDSEIDTIYEEWPNGGSRAEVSDEDLFSQIDNKYDYNNQGDIRVLHSTFKGLRKIGFLKYKDEQDNIQETLVNEGYELNEDFGDIEVKWEWIPEVYETWKIKISKPIYLRMRPIPGQFKDINNIYECKLPYYGAIFDNINSEETSLMDRLKTYQYYYNIVMFRLETLLASDKGKKILMNINSIPRLKGMKTKEWAYFFDTSSFSWFDPGEEGSNYNDVNTVAKVLDMSLVSDIEKYIKIAAYIKQQAGDSVGITEAVEGQVSPNQSVRNNQQNLIQTSNILEPYFSLHDHVKKHVLQALIENAKIAYSNEDSVKLSYVLDDGSTRLLNLDIGKLDNDTLGVFVNNTAKAAEAKELIRQLTHAALQNQKVELSDIISVVRQEGVAEAEETLKVAEQNRREFEEKLQKDRLEAEAEQSEKIRQREREKHEEDKELIILKEEERRKTEIVKGGLVGASFNPDQDKDRDGINDFVEIARHGLDAEIRQTKQQLERDQFEHQKEVDKKKLEQEDKKLANEERNLKAGVAGNTNTLKS